MFLIGNKGLFPTDPVLGAMVGAARPRARLFWEKGGSSRLNVLDARGPVASSTAQAIKFHPAITVQSAGSLTCH